MLMCRNCIGSPITTTRRARYSSGNADAMSHWLASSITSRSKKLGANGTRPRTDSEVTRPAGQNRPDLREQLVVPLEHVATGLVLLIGGDDQLQHGAMVIQELALLRIHS